MVIARVPHGESIVHPGSRCPRCGHAIRWWENVPLLSWLLLRGRCSGCQAPISPRYPLIELLTGLLFVGCLLRTGGGWPLVRALLMVGFLVPLAAIDLEHWVLPFELTLPGIALALLTAIPLGRPTLISCLIGAAVAFGGFWALELGLRMLLGKEALGAGDKWLFALVGAFLGWQPLFGVLLFSNVQGAVVGGALLLVRGRAGPPAPVEGAPAAGDDDWAPGPTHLPFGPWIAVAALEVLLLGPWLLATFPGPLTRMLVGAHWWWW